jgi:signal transduction histidine kinase
MKQAMSRIIREGCGNAVFHGRCSELELRIIVDPEFCELTIQDNGKGFDTEAVLREGENKGLGLHNMQMLAQSFNGAFCLRSEPGKGTTIQIKFPLVQFLQPMINEGGGVA